jgi:CRISPR-associated exonuclease Cas4
MEELLVGFLEPDQVALDLRASTLTRQVIVEGAARPDHSELARTALRTYSHNELQPYLTKLVPEMPLYGARSDTILVSARSDAIALDEGVPFAVFDWKSDIAPTQGDRDTYASQLLEYLDLVGAEKGAVVYMTSGEVRWVHRRSAANDHFVQ